VTALFDAAQKRDDRALADAVAGQQPVQRVHGRGRGAIKGLGSDIGSGIGMLPGAVLGGGLGLLGGPLGETQCFARAIRSSAWHDLDPTGSDFDGAGDDFFVFIVRECWRFASGANGTNHIGAGGDLEFDLRLEQGVIDFVILERSGNRNG
jgi:hypothetical protein